MLRHKTHTIRNIAKYKGIILHRIYYKDHSIQPYYTQTTHNRNKSALDMERNFYKEKQGKEIFTHCKRQKLTKTNRLIQYTHTHRTTFV